MLHDAGRGHVQSYRSVHQPGPIQVDPDPTAPRQEVHLGTKSRQQSEGLGWGQSGGRTGLQGPRGVQSEQSWAGVQLGPQGPEQALCCLRLGAILCKGGWC